MESKSKDIVQELLSKAGVTVNGDAPYDIAVHNENFYTRVLREGSLGLGESYMDGWWDACDLDEFFNKVLRSDLEKRVRPNFRLIFFYGKYLLFNLQKKSRAFEVGERHYDVGNDLYEAMLDKRLTYTCGYWRKAKTLEEAQEAKLDLVCRKLHLKPGQRILDIGSGWGSFMGYASEKYGVQCVGVTVSKEQAVYANKRYAHLPVETRFMDYRDMKEKFDHVVSLGMFEHVGYKNYKEYMKKVKSLLKDENSLFLLHTIGANRTKFSVDPWIAKYIFPNGILPSVQQIAESIDSVFVLEDWHSFGEDYDKTLMCWFRNVEGAWDKLKDGYDERFYRMWKYYLLSCAGSFRSRKNHLWQIVMSKNGIVEGYSPQR